MILLRIDYPEEQHIERPFDSTDMLGAIQWLLNNLSYWCCDEDITVTINGVPYEWGTPVIQKGE